MFYSYLNFNLSQQAGPSKNQKSVTDFFKNATNSASQKPTAIKTQTQAKSPEKGFKRKASSPILIDDDNFEQLATKGYLNDVSSSNTTKKIKTENGSISSSPSKTSSKKKSPNKENIFHTKISPKKNLLADFEGINHNVIKIDNSVIEKKNEKLVSSLPESEKKVLNHVLPNNGCKKESSVFENGDKSEGVVTPKKQSPFKNNGYINSPNRRTPKKSPLQGMELISTYF